MKRLVTSPGGRAGLFAVGALLCAIAFWTGLITLSQWDNLWMGGSYTDSYSAAAMVRLYDYYAEETSGLLDSLQSTLDQVEVLLSNLLTLVPPQVTELVQHVVDSLLEWLNVAVPDLLANVGLIAGQKAMGVPSLVIALVIFIMATYLLTADYPYLRTRVAQHLDEGLLHFLTQVRTISLGAFGGYLKAELLLSATGQAVAAAACGQKPELCRDRLERKVALLRRGAAKQEDTICCK